jgi:hypothetical protein
VSMFASMTITCGKFENCCLFIRDQLRRILKIPNFIPIEYKTHNDSLNDRSSFRNPNVVHKVVPGARSIPSSSESGNTGSYGGGGGYGGYNRGNYGGSSYNQRGGYNNRYNQEGNPSGGGGNPSGWKGTPGNSQSTPFSPNAQTQQQAASHPPAQHSNTNAWGKKSSNTGGDNPGGPSAPALSPAHPAPHPSWGNRNAGGNPSGGSGAAWTRKTRDEAGGAPPQPTAPPQSGGSVEPSGGGSVWSRKKSE